MRFFLDKCVPFLFALVLAVQECLWGGWNVPFFLLLLGCAAGMGLLFLWEKKLRNVLALAVGSFILIMAVAVYTEMILFSAELAIPVFSALQCILLARMMDYLPVRIGLSLAFVATAVTLAFFGENINQFLWILSLYLFIASVSEMFHVRYYKSQVEGSWTRGLMPFFAIMFLQIWILPVKETPFDWSFILNPVNHIYQSFKEIGENIYDSFDSDNAFFSYSLYTNQNRKENHLGGVFEQTEKVFMKVKANQGGRTIYLNGCFSDEYTGLGWKQHYVNEKFASSEEALAKQEKDWVIETQKWHQIEDEYIVKERTIDVRIERMKTKTVFYPSFLDKISTKNRELGMNGDTANFAFRKAKKRGFEYSIHYADINEHSHYVRDYLEALDNFQYEEQKLRERAEFIKEHYTKLPDSLPNTVYELTGEVTKGESTSYGKMLAIGNYLRTFQYEKNVEDVPAGRDFVEYFLENSKKGYCTYFATAAAVMGRCAGIPTRYVEGLIIKKDCPYDAKERCYLVDGTCLHAWCEAYFEGFGWVRIEATPGYAEKSVIWERGSVDYNQQETKQDVSQEPVVSLEPEEQEVVICNNNVWWVLAWILVVVVLGVGGIFLVRWRQLKGKKPDEFCQIYFRKQLFYLRKFGYVLQDGETLSEFRERVLVDAELKGAGADVWFSDAVEIFLRLRYGKFEPTDEEIIELSEGIGRLEDVTGKRFGKVRKWVIKVESWFGG